MSKYSHINWEELIQEQKDSGLTVSQFCESKEINEKAFYSHKKKFRKLDDDTSSFERVIIDDSETVGFKVNGILFEFDEKYLTRFLRAFIS